VPPPAINNSLLESLSFALYVKLQTPGKEKFYGIRQERVNELAVLKLKYPIILSTQERKYETQTFNEKGCALHHGSRFPVFPALTPLDVHLVI
jgi:hypothetical protein